MRLPGIEVADKTGKLSRYVSAVLVLAASHWLTCQGEQAALLPRGFSGDLTQLRICILREPGIEAAEETIAFRTPLGRTARRGDH